LRKRLYVITGSFLFISIFFYYYKKSKNFRHSINCAVLSILIIFGYSFESKAKGVEGFNFQQQQQQSRTTHRSGFFSGRSSNDGSGPGKNDGPGGDDDSGMPKFPQTQSVQDTQNRLDNIDEYIAKMEETSDSEEEQCRVESKVGFKELPDGKIFSYNMEQGRGLKKQAKKVWKNPKAKQEVLRMLNRFDDENAKIQEKSLKGFKSLSELKNSGPGPRIIIYRGKNEPPTVIGFCMRDDLDATLAKLKGKYN
jgi:hypothetical protein